MEQTKFAENVMKGEILKIGEGVAYKVKDTADISCLPTVRLFYLEYLDYPVLITKTWHVKVVTQGV